MKLEYVLLANHAESLPDGLVNLLGGGVRVYDVVLPHTVPVFYLVARALLTSEERGRIFPFSMQIRDPQGELIPGAQIEGEHTSGPSPYPELPDIVALLIAVQGFTFSVAGLYKLTFCLGDLDPIELPILALQKRAE